MNLAFRSIAAMICLLSAQVVLAQNQPCDEIVNTGEKTCIYQIVGQDSCPVIESTTCPSGCGYNNNNILLGPGWECENPEGSLPKFPSFAYSDSNTNASAPKWSAPPPGISGNASVISSAIACGIHKKCTCELGAFGQLSCISEQCGLSILWTLAKDPNSECESLDL